MKTRTIFEASAPGRLDVMGGIADYSGSLVLQMPIRQKTTVKLSLREDGICNLISRSSSGEALKSTISINDFGSDRDSYTRARVFFNSHSDALWAGYVVGCGLVLRDEKQIKFRGADFEIFSDVPLGKGVSSSASLEVATMKALGQAFSVDFRETELAVLAQKVENLIVGAPCGLMDQLASYFGIEGKLLPILCQPDKLFDPVSIPTELKFVGIDSGVRHSVGGSSYSDVRCAAFMGYTIIAKELGVTLDDLVKARQSNIRSHLPFGGYLCNISKQEFEKQFSATLPKTMRGEEFIGTFGTTIDPITRVNHDTDYKIYDCTAHPIYENERVHEFRSLISSGNDPGRLGELMYQSHKSYSICGLGSLRTDEIVSMAKSLSSSGIIGAKITGGGSGGTVCLLVQGPAGLQAARRIHQSMSSKYDANLVFFD